MRDPFDWLPPGSGKRDSTEKRAMREGKSTNLKGAERITGMLADFEPLLSHHAV